MEAVIFVGLRGAGKSTFYKERFFDTHLRLSLDKLRTRHREGSLLQACIDCHQRFVVDNTNPTRAERQVYIQPARSAGFRVVGYYFQSRVEDCKRRNEQRPAARQVPMRGILGTAGRMELPSVGEDYFRWRSEDAHRNALNAHCYWLLRKQGRDTCEATEALRGLTVPAKNELLYRAGINYNDLPAWQRRGSGLSWEEYERVGDNPVTCERVLARRRRILRNLDLPVKDTYSVFLRGIVGP